MGQNALSQSHCTILNQLISRGFFMKVERLLNFSEWLWSKNGCGHSCHTTQKLAVSEEWIEGVKSFFACWCKFRKAKSYLNGFLVPVVKNGHVSLVHGTLKYAVSQKWIYELSLFFVFFVWYFYAFLYQREKVSVFTGEVGEFKWQWLRFVLFLIYLIYLKILVSLKNNT